eukprot:m.9166 g.9166  ORF g.9166 m.9166 type:complete len:53 (+) comp21134_c0_seq2:199-357(+)
MRPKAWKLRVNILFSHHKNFRYFLFPKGPYLEGNDLSSYFHARLHLVKRPPA